MTDRAPDLFVGIDAGTTGVTVAVFDAAGREQSSAYREYPCLYPHPGWVEQDTETVWRSVCSACRSAVAGLSQGIIRSVGISSQRGTFVLLDEDKRPLGPGVVWNDSRAADIEDEISRLIDPDRFRELTGMPLSASWTSAKLYWLRERMPELWARVAHVCNDQEYFLYRLGAEGLETDPSSLTLNGMLDIRKLTWSAELCEALGIDNALLPPVGSPAAQAGVLSREAASETGLPAGVAICRGGGDQQCAAVGAGVVRQGLAEVTVGTAAMLVAHLERPELVTGRAPYVGAHAVPGKWDAEGGAFSIGGCLRWWRDTVATDEAAEAGRLGRSPYDVMAETAAKAPPGSRGLLFHPFMAGQVTPFYDASARGGLFGLGLDHDRACVTRALFEGCAMEMRLMVDAVDRDLEGGIRELRITGGGTKSPVFLKIQADVMGRTLVKPAYGECTVLGAAILGAVGAGCFDDVEQGVAAMVRTGATVEPDRSLDGLYGDLHGLFIACYRSLSGGETYGRLFDFQKKYY
ncbi:MAG: FGGY-family carbohydrate kinase [Alphaproteobacteria bacterium]